jgi:hypothetical protein
MTKFSNKEICNIIKAYIKQQNKICKQFGMLKCRSDYAQKIPNNTIKYLTENNIRKIRKDEEYSDICPYMSERHYSLNLLALNKHQSLEWRLFNGTIQIRKIKQYIKFVLQFCLKNAKI